MSFAWEPARDQVRPECADQGCQAAEDNVPKDVSAQQVADQASQKQTGNGGGSEKGKNGECFRETDLNGVIRQPQGICQKGEHDVKSSDDRCLGDP